jgi:hypothetical protein
MFIILAPEAKYHIPGMQKKKQIETHDAELIPSNTEIGITVVKRQLE